MKLKGLIVYQTGVLLNDDVHGLIGSGRPIRVYASETEASQESRRRTREITNGFKIMNCTVSDVVIPELEQLETRGLVRLRRLPGQVDPDSVWVGKWIPNSSGYWPNCGFGKYEHGRKALPNTYGDQQFEITRKNASDSQWAALLVNTLKFMKHFHWTMVEFDLGDSHEFLTMLEKE